MILQVYDATFHLYTHRFDGFAAWQAGFAMVTKKKDAPSEVRAAQCHRAKRFHLPCRTEGWAITIVWISKQNGIVETEANAASQQHHYFAKHCSWITYRITASGPVITQLPERSQARLRFIRFVIRRLVLAWRIKMLGTFAK